MIISGRILLAFLTVMAQTTTNKDGAAISAQRGYVKDEMIYALNSGPTPQCHASTIVESKHGLVAAWFGGEYEGHPGVGIWVSRHDKSGWSHPVEVADEVESKDKRYPCWNPVLFHPLDGPLLLFYKIGPNPREWWGMLKTSPDGGRTWNGAERLPDGIYGPIKNKPVRLEDGTILCPSSSEHHGWRVHFEITPDLGKTWEVIGPINDGKEFEAIQPGILIYPDGHLQAFCRSRQGVIVQSRSNDGGRTWSRLTATSLLNPNSGIDALTLSDDRHILVYNDTIKGRSPLNVALSSDGTFWKNVLLLENEKGDFSYPAVIQASDGLIHITYTYLRKTIKHVVVDPRKLSQN
ncbi:MAG: exo-alpha-sialidase [Candidatus Aminicenantes bacterium]|nr:exo-alpha-sialidase [Candidatus Aminicenantes bacterium]